MEYAHKINQVVLGKRYKVAHAIVISSRDNKEYAIPIIPNLHKDEQFSVEHQHYHIDGRFKIPHEVITDYGIVDGKTNMVITVDDLTHKYPGQHQFQKVVFKTAKCIRIETGISPFGYFQESNKVYENWYKQYIGSKCEGKRCPHLGATMIEGAKHLYCPLHDLHASKKTGKIVKHPNCK